MATPRRLWARVVTTMALVLVAALAPGSGVRPQLTGSTTRVSVSSDGTVGDGRSPSISADGRFVAFVSFSSLVIGDTGVTPDIYVHDLVTGATTRVSVSSNGLQANLQSGAPSISSDGRYLAFVSQATNLVPGDANGAWDVFVHDRLTSVTSRVSVASDGTQADGDSLPPTPISADGRFVAFTSRASNLVAGDTNTFEDVFVHDRETGHTSRVSVSSSGAQGNSDSRDPSMSPDGRFVAFTSFAGLVPGDSFQIFVHDRAMGTTTGVAGGNALSERPSISADGRFVAFESRASNLVPGDTNGSRDVFLHDRANGITTRVSVASDGTQADLESGTPSISAEGRFVAFGSNAINLVSGDANGSGDVFLYDRLTATTTRVSLAWDGTEGNLFGGSPSISADGRHVAFDSSSSNLVPGADNNNTQDVFVRYRNGAPVAVGDVASVLRDSGANFVDVLVNDSDPDGDAITVTSVTQPASGVAAIAPGGAGVTYTPNIAFVGGTDTFTYGVSDGLLGATSTATVTVSVTGNRAPVAVGDTAEVAASSAKNPIDVLANDSDPEGDPVSVVGVTEPADGAAAVAPGVAGVSYTPRPGFAGADTFTYTISDGQLTATATVAVTVTSGARIAFLPLLGRGLAGGW